MNGRFKKGSTLGPYKITRLIGQGGMGEVYEAVDPILDRKVALKVILPEFNDSIEVARRFRAEGQTLAKLNHQNVVTVHALGEDQGNNYLVMEFVDGVPLWDILESRKMLSPKEALHYFRQLLAGMKALHDHGIIHRDIKPKNIIIRKDNSVKIVDFGIAKVNGQSERGVTQTGAMVGSLYYIAPEVIEGESASIQSDIWSLGINLYEMLVGKKPFTDNSRSALIRKIATEPISFPHETNLPWALQALIFRMCEKYLDRRYTSVDEVLQDLEKYEPASNSPLLKASIPVPALQPMPLAESRDVKQLTPQPPTRGSSSDARKSRPTNVQTEKPRSGLFYGTLAGLAFLTLAVTVIKFKNVQAPWLNREPAAATVVEAPAPAPTPETPAALEPVTFTAQHPTSEQVIWVDAPASIEFIWSGNLGPQFYLQVAKDSEFRDIIFEAANPKSPLKALIPPTIELEDRFYFWRVTQKNTPDIEPSFAATRFQVVTPTPPKLTWPLDKASVTDGSAFLFSWLPKTGVTSYRFELARDRNFQLLHTTKESTETQVVINGISEGSYFWRVRAEDKNGVSQWSPVRHLQMKEPLSPSVAIQPLPTTPAHAQPAKKVTPKPVAQLKLKPKRVEPVAKPAKPAPKPEIKPKTASKPTVTATPIKPAAKSMPPLPAAQVTPPPLAAADKASPDMPVPKLKLPPNGASIVPLNGVQNPISFKWEILKDAESYVLEVSTDRQFKKVLQTVPAPGNQVVIADSFQVGTYYWRVRSVKGPKKSKWSAPFIFEVSK